MLANHFHLRLRVRLARRQTGLSPSVNSQIFLLTDPRPCFLWIIYVISVLFLLCPRARLLINALWSRDGKRLTSWLSFVMSYCESVTFPLVSCVRCGA